jgi:LAS superfamily LD-carboxypeptidase LdcB
MEDLSDTVRNLKKRIQDLRNRLDLEEENGCNPFTPLILPDELPEKSTTETVVEEVNTPEEPTPQIPLDDLRLKLIAKKQPVNLEPKKKPSKNKKGWVS